MRVGVFCDVSNLYYSIIRKFGDGCRLDYSKYYKYCADIGNIEMAIAYGVKASANAHNFIHYLKTNGYETKFKRPRVFKTAGGVTHKADCDVDITVDIMKSASELDLVILGTADGDFSALVDNLETKILVLGCKISKPLRERVTCVEIPKSMLVDK